MKILFLVLFLFTSSVTSKELIIDCENNFTYKITNYNTNNQNSYYKFNNDDWIEIKHFKIKDNNAEFFIPNMKYLACADESLAVCEYSIRIAEFLKKRPTVSEVILNDCFIGTMGCNKYEKGLMLNQSFCSSR